MDITFEKYMKISVLILAAGGSSRLGQPKQLVTFEGQTLITKTIKTALAISEEVAVVLGANIDLIKSEIKPFDKHLKIIENTDWQQGMGTSISLGVQKLSSETDGILILLTDQPLISQVLLQSMVQTFAEKKAPIVACNYGEQIGVPILFNKSFFPELINLKADQGAKVFLKNYVKKIALIDFQEGLFDIDTVEDLEKLAQLSNKNTEE
jgi:molybdenum cofactor cytidylyltransferase